MESAAFSNGEIVNEQNIAQECGVSGPTVRQYFQILDDTLVGRFLPVFQKRPKRRVIRSPKFYYFDVGLANFLLKRGPIVPKSESFGKAFEHFLFQEMIAHSHYSGIHYPLFYWRTASQLEVDFILGDHEVAVEVKSTDMAHPRHAKGLLAFAEEYTVKKLILVTQDPRPRKMGAVHVLPWADFLHRLWDGHILPSQIHCGGLRPRELVARVRAALRKAAPRPDPGEVLRSGELVLDTEKRRATLKGETVELRPKEYELLYVLMKNEGRVLTRNFLEETIWGTEYFGSSRAIDSTVTRLRAKLGKHAAHIEAVQGIGYRYENPKS